MIYNLVDRSILLADKKFHNKNIKRIVKILQNNGYELPFIEICIKIRLRQFKFNNVPSHNNNNNNRITFVIPYMGSLFYMFRIYLKYIKFPLSQLTITTINYHYKFLKIQHVS